jgi:phosphopantetheine adenylyltransferase
VNIFGRENVAVVIGKNVNKDVDFECILYHMAPYKINFRLAQDLTLADFCKNNGISYLVRGIRNAVDAEYELKLDFLNREINENLSTVFFPTKHVFSNVSSSSINELLKYRKFNVAKKYMDEDAMNRFYNKRPKFVVFFGKSCIGKTFYLENIFKSENIAEADKVLWETLGNIHGKAEAEKIRAKSKDLIYGGHSIWDLMKIYSTERYWDEFFDFIEKNFPRRGVGGCIGLKNLDDVFVVDFASLGIYWDTIPSRLRGQLYLVKLENSEENRKIFVQKKNFGNKIQYLDVNYREPAYFDETTDIAQFCKG